MQFSDQTITILRNFSQINEGILFQAGKDQSTVSKGKNMFVKATVGETIPQEFAIYDLPRFLSTLSLFDAPELDFQEKSLRIIEGNRKLSYTYADPSLIITPPKKSLNVPAPLLQLTLDAKDLVSLEKAANVLSVPDLVFQVGGSIGDNELESDEVRIVATDLKNDTADHIDLTPESKAFDLVKGSKFRIVFKFDTIKLLPGDYDVKLSFVKIPIGVFQHKSLPVTYFTTGDATDSKLG